MPTTAGGGSATVRDKKGRTAAPKGGGRYRQATGSGCCAVLTWKTSCIKAGTVQVWLLGRGWVWVRSSKSILVFVVGGGEVKVQAGTRSQMKGSTVMQCQEIDSGWV